MNNTEIKVVAITREVKDEDITAEELSDSLTDLAGEAAGVCYMKDDYFSNGIKNRKQAHIRAISAAERGHASPYDHGHITFRIWTSKAIAMVLNSLGVYTTSEKSARYTLMKPDTVREEELYNKWIGKIQTMVLGEFPDYDDTFLRAQMKKKAETDKFEIKNRNITIDNDGTEDGIAEVARCTEIWNSIIHMPDAPSYKIAQENARYMISVFTKTALLYTVSYRQAMLIVDYFTKFYNENESSDNRFYSKLAREMKDFVAELQSKIGGNVLHDNKNQSIRFLETEKSDKVQMINDSYTLRYSCSLACVAQLQRHRTIRHSMYVDTIDNLKFYIPEIVKLYECDDEWLDDIKSIAYVYPQGVIVDVTEQGIVEDFAMKCKERLCGRAFKETMDNVRDCTVEFIRAAYDKKLCSSNAKLVMNMAIVSNEPDVYSYSVVPRCAFKDFKCTDGCRWGKLCGIRRII